MLDKLIRQLPLWSPEGDGGGGAPAAGGTPGAEGGTGGQTETGSQASDSGSEGTASDASPDGQRQQADGSPGAANSDASQEPKPLSRYRQRIERLTGDRDSAIREASHYRGILEGIGYQPARLDPLAYRSDAEYQRALIQDTATRQQHEFARTHASNAETQRRQIESEIWAERTAEFAETAQDFKDVAGSASVPYSEHGIAMVRQHPEGPRIAYYLGKNPHEARRLASLPPLETAYALGELGHRLKSGAQPRVVSGASAPVQTVRGGGQLNTPDPGKMEMAAYAEWFAKRNQPARR